MALNQEPGVQELQEFRIERREELLSGHSATPELLQLLNS
jgi:hypothetical protein